MIDGVLVMPTAREGIPVAEAAAVAVVVSDSTLICASGTCAPFRNLLVAHVRQR